jgi:hypothetical protein
LYTQVWVRKQSLPSITGDCFEIRRNNCRGIHLLHFRTAKQSHGTRHKGSLACEILGQGAGTQDSRDTYPCFSLYRLLPSSILFLLQLFHRLLFPSLPSPFLIPMMSGEYSMCSSGGSGSPLSQTLSFREELSDPISPS